MKRPVSSIKTGSAEELEAVEQCFDAYGGDIAKWPADARAQFGDVASSDAFASACDGAASLDGFLDAASQPQMSPDLKNRITAAYAPPAKSANWLAGLHDLIFGPQLVPAGALAGLGALGLLVGVMTDAGQPLTPEYEAYAYLENSLAFASLDEEDAEWDAE